MSSSQAVDLLNDLLYGILASSYSNYNLETEINESTTGEKYLDLASIAMLQMNYAKAKKFLEKAIEKNHYPAMIAFAKYYDQYEHNEDQMKKWYLKAIKHNQKDGAYFLAKYYQEKGNDELMLKYLKIGVEKFGDLDSMMQLGKYYYEKKDNENTVKYYTLAAEKGSSSAMYNLGVHYMKQNNTEEFIKYFKAALLTLETHKSPIFNPIIFTLIENEIDLKYVQENLTRIGVTNEKVSSMMQYKTNKSKLPNYKVHEECTICCETTDLQMYDCLGHHFCLGCTVKLTKCPICKYDKNVIPELV